MKCAYTEQVDSLNSSFKTLSVGHIASRVTGEAIGEIDAKTLKELVRVFYASRDRDPVIIDWGHNSSPDEASGSPESAVALGEVVDLYIEGDGLWVRPRYSERTKKTDRRCSALSSSAHLPTPANYVKNKSGNTGGKYGIRYLTRGARGR